jgi:hypothetical protein
MILGICGSGRKEGNTGALVEEVLKGTASIRSSLTVRGWSSVLPVTTVTYQDW